MAFQDFTLQQIAQLAKNTLVENMGIEITEIGDDFISGKMPVTNRNVQPMRLLHGGASVAFAETLGSFTAIMCVPDPTKQTAVGLEINANHLRGVKEGNWVYGKCVPLHIGRTTVVCEIKITNEQGKLVCSSRFTAAIVPI
jgi:1,4-dihydroxy-2-naphthoyl-CoA hydrolase